MGATESGTYRVYGRDEAARRLRLVEAGTDHPTTVRATGYDEALQETVDGLRPGNLVSATLEWGPDGDPAFADLTVETRTLFAFVDGTPDVFEQAKRTFREGQADGMAMASTVTYGTDGDANGVLYTVAKQSGDGDVFADFVEGRKPLEPLLGKLVDGGADPPFAVFVVRPTSEPFVAVYLTLDRDGLLANTLRDEYDCPRPDVVE